MISGTIVTVVRPGEPMRDRLGNRVAGEPVREAVHGVLVAAPTAEETEAAREAGHMLAYTLHFPKSFTGRLLGCTVELPEPWANAKGYRVVGDPRPYMDANTPGRWNRPVGVEAADG